jgi:hypothetical protein
MNSEDINKMWLQSQDDAEGMRLGFTTQQHYFAALVAAAERNRTWTQAHWTEYERSIAAAEREACAKLCDEIAIDMWKLYKGRPPYKGDEEGRASDFTQGRSAGADDCAEAIRRRTDAA